ncbi:MAG: hypothetical protein M1812_001412 [Candelaria pacifica]|nr:MAG: hypothetical protein M1812_001412 [Candelaria pacifica]
MPRKRKNSVVQAGEVQKKYGVAWKVSAATKKVMRSNAYGSPLLKLPPEIRNYIYELVLGGQLVHIEYRSERRTVGRELFHRICGSTESEQATYKLFNEESENEASEDEDEDEDVPYMSRADSCEERHSECHWGGSEDSERIDTTILLTCRQVYYEARFIPFSTNTFSITSAGILKQFLKELHPVQRNAIGGLHIEYILTGSCDDFEPWEDLFTVENIKSLKGLRRLHLCIEQQFHREIQHYRDMREEGFQEMCFQGILKLQRLPLEEVTVVMTDDEFGEDEDEYRAWKLADMILCDAGIYRGDANSKELWAVYERLQEKYRWTLAEKRVFCEKLKAQFLQPCDQADCDTVMAEEASEREKQEAAMAQWRGVNYILTQRYALYRT